MIYLDNNASTRVDPRVLEAMTPWFCECWANPSSIRHSEGRRALEAVNAARWQVAQLVKCDVDEIVFTSGATESNALAIQCAHPNGQPPSRIITSNVEHHSSQAAALHLGNRIASPHIVAVGPSGAVTRKQFDGLRIDERTLVTIQWVNNETGIINEIEGIARLVKERGGLIHVDAVQAIGKVPIDLSACPIDLLTLSGHKIHGPKGVGALFVRREVKLVPFIGGGPQEHGLRAGTENVPGIVGLGKACELLRLEGANAIAGITHLRERLERGLLLQCSQTQIIGQNSPRVGNTTFAGWSTLDNREILRGLDAAGICASAGSACNAESPGGSYVLQAMCVSPNLLPSVVRFSLGRENTAEEIDRVVKTIARIVASQYAMRQAMPQSDRYEAHAE